MPLTLELSPGEVAELVHELRTYQVELEIQNEELRAAQEDLAEARGRYQEVYDLAPVGYVVLDEQGVAVEANRAAVGLPGGPRGAPPGGGGPARWASGRPKG